MALQTPLSGGRFALEVDGIAVGSLKTFSGLGAEGSIAQATSGPEVQTKKHMAGFRWTPGRAATGIAMGKALYAWIKTALGSVGSAHSGTFKTADFNGKVRATRSFSNALLTEFTVPNLDASNREAGIFDIAFEAERVTWGPGSGETLAPALVQQKTWVTSNFKITIGDLPCSRVAKVDAFTWRSPVAAGGVGLPRGVSALQAGRASVPDLSLSISAADYPAWQAAAKKWFIDGACLEANEMRGRISLLGPTMKDSDELGAIELYNVGFKRFDHEEAVSGSDQVARFTVVLYVERMALSIKEYEA
jgi:hypothetical protein